MHSEKPNGNNPSVFFLLQGNKTNLTEHNTKINQYKFL